MSVFEPNYRHLREVLIFRGHLKKTAVDAHRIRFRSGEFNVEDRHGGGKEKSFEDSKLEALLAENSCQTQEELAESLEVNQQAISKRLKAMGMIRKQGNWVPYELESRDVKRHFFACEQLLQRHNRNFEGM